MISPFQLIRRNGLGTALFAVLLILAGVILWNLHTPRRDPRIDAIRKQGYPVTLAELDAWYPRVPDGENAALIYTNAFARTSMDNKAGWPDKSWLPPRGELLEAEDRTEWTNLIATNQEALRLLCSAASLSRSRYAIDLKQRFP